MNVKVLLHQLELSFWDAFIPLMSKSSSVRYIVPRVYWLIHIKEFQDTVKLTLFLVMVGLLLGFVLGALLCGALLATWVKFLGITDIIRESSLAVILLDRFPAVLALLPQEFDAIRSFFQ